MKLKNDFYLISFFSILFYSSGLILLYPFDYIYSVYRKIKRFFIYGKFGYKNLEGQRDSIIKFLKFTLERTENNTQSIRISLKLCNRLLENNYDICYKKYIKKWSSEETIFIPTNNPMFSQPINLNNEKLNEEKQKEKIKEFIDSVNEDDNIKQRDINNLFGIISKYHQQWEY